MFQFISNYFCGGQQAVLEIPERRSRGRNSPIDVQDQVQRQDAIEALDEQALQPYHAYPNEANKKVMMIAMYSHANDNGCSSSNIRARSLKSLPENATSSMHESLVKKDAGKVEPLSREFYLSDSCRKYMMLHMSEPEKFRLQALNKFSYGPALERIFKRNETFILKPSLPPFSLKIKFVDNLDEVPDDATGIYMSHAEKEKRNEMNRIRGA